MVFSERTTCFLYRGTLSFLITVNISLLGVESYHLISMAWPPLALIISLLLNSNIVSTFTNVIVGMLAVFLSLGSSKKVLCVFSYVFVPIIMFLVNMMPVGKCLIYLKWEFTDLSITSLVVSFLLTVSGMIFTSMNSKFAKPKRNSLMSDISIELFTFEETKWAFSEEMKNIEYIEVTDEDSVNVNV